MPAFGSIAISLACSVLVFGAYACKEVPNPNSSDGNNGNNGTNGNNGNNGGSGQTVSFLGDWSGVYKNTDAGAELRQTEASANFQATDPQSGSFRLDLPTLNNVYVVGTYQIFSQSSMLLAISQSTISTIGEPNSRIEITYNLLGNSLELRNDRVTLKLIRSGATPASGGNTPPNTQLNGQSSPTDPTYGRWHCNDHLGQLWQMNILPTSVFNIEISDPKRESGLVWVQGPFTVSKPGGVSTVAMTVVDADIVKYRGMQLTAVLLGSGQLVLTRNTGGEKLNCDRG